MNPLELDLLPVELNSRNCDQRPEITSPCHELHIFLSFTAADSSLQTNNYYLGRLQLD